MTIEVPSEIKSIKKVSSKILKSLLPYGISDERLFDIRLCTEEAVRNAIIHGNRLNKRSFVRVNYRIENDKISIEVEDEGSGFKPGSLPDPTEEENVTKASGRGVYLIKRLMDRVEFNERGNKVSMEKSLR